MTTTLAWKVVNLAVLLALAVVLLGAWTRISDAGLSCPDWPGCYGHMVLPADPEKLAAAQNNFPETALDTNRATLEMGHRYLAGALGLLVAGLAGFAYRFREVVSYPVRASYALLLLVILQAMFGMWTVTLKLYPPVVTLHLLGGVTTLTLLLYLRVRIKLLWVSEREVQPLSAIKIVKIAIFVLFLQIVLGGWTSSNYAGPACSHWISCNPGSGIQPDFKQGFSPMITIGPNYQGGVLPVEARSAIQIGHRLGALVVFFTILLMSIKLYPQKILRYPLQLLLLLFSGQIVLGVLNVMFAVPPILAMLHHAIAVALLLVLLWIYSRLVVVEGVAYE